MKKFLLFIFCWTLLLVSLPCAAESNSQPIIIQNYQFTPPSLTVSVGTKVTWTNHDEVPHTISEINKAFRSPALDTDDSYSFTFANPGVYHYFCTLHSQMVGTITVTASP